MLLAPSGQLGSVPLPRMKSASFQRFSPSLTARSSETVTARDLKTAILKAPNLIFFRMPQSAGRYLFSFRRYSDFLEIIQFTSWKRTHWQLYDWPLVTKVRVGLAESVAEIWN